MCLAFDTPVPPTRGQEVEQLVSRVEGFNTRPLVCYSSCQHCSEHTPYKYSMHGRGRDASSHFWTERQKMKGLDINNLLICVNWSLCGCMLKWRLVEYSLPSLKIVCASPDRWCFMILLKSFTRSGSSVLVNPTHKAHQYSSFIYYPLFEWWKK